VIISDNASQIIPPSNQTPQKNQLSKNSEKDLLKDMPPKLSSMEQLRWVIQKKKELEQAQSNKQSFTESEVLKIPLKKQHNEADKSRAETDMFEKNMIAKMFEALSANSKMEVIEDFLKSRPKSKVQKFYTKNYEEFAVPSARGVTDSREESVIKPTFDFTKITASKMKMSDVQKKLRQRRAQKYLGKLSKGKFDEKASHANLGGYGLYQEKLKEAMREMI